MKHLIFDCGGVLVYPRLGEWNLPFGAAQILGERAADLYGSKYLTVHRQCLGWLDEARLVPDVEEERRLRLEYIRALDAGMGWRLTPQEQRRMADDFTDNIHRYGFFDDVTPWLTRWKQRYRLGMLSDAMPSILKFLEEYGILDLFDGTVISTQLGVIKPDRRMYEAMLGALGADPGDCLFVDDRVCNLMGAQAVGIRGVQMARAEFLPEALWDGPVVRNLEALNALLESDEFASH